MNFEGNREGKTSVLRKMKRNDGEKKKKRRRKKGKKRGKGKKREKEKKKKKEGRESENLHARSGVRRGSFSSAKREGKFLEPPDLANSCSFQILKKIRTLCLRVVIVNEDF